ncbi:MAG: hypothetical protein QM766_16850 [Burkholderiaceae bacterium]
MASHTTHLTTGMGILGFVVLIVVVGSLVVMSKTSRIVLLILLAGSLYYGYTISAVFNGGNEPEFGELKIAMTLLSANIGGFIVAAVLGVMKRTSSGDAHYTARRKSFFAFLTKWVALYSLYAFVGGKLIDLAMGEDDVGWFFMRIWGLHGFIALLLLWFVFKRKKTI